MASGLGKILNIEKEEFSSVSILLLQSVFLGIYAGTFDVSAQSYFLETFSAELIPKAFAYSGGVGIIITSVYSFLQSRIKFSVFAVINLLFVAITTTALRIGFQVYDHDILVFAMFVLMGPLTIISFLGFWGTVGRMFSLRQGKRLFGMIDTGQIMGIILASYAIPVLLRFNFQILNSLYVCSGSIILALIIQVFISSKYSLISRDAGGEKKRRSNFFDLFRRKYTSLMVGFVVLSVLAAFFIHYSFLVVTEENYPDPNALASFLGVFMGTVMVFTLIIKTFVYARLMKTYGLKLALTISPILLGIFVIGAIVVGSVYGYAASSAGFTFFFLLLVSGKLFSKSFKDSIEVPSSKILYQSLDPEVRYDVQSRVDGTVNELAAFSSGLLMAGLAMIASFKIIHFSYVLAAILLFWAFLAFRLYRSYRFSLKDSLVKYQDAGKREVKNSIDKIESLLATGSERDMEKLIEYAPQSWNGFITGNLNILLKSPGRLKELAISWIDRLNISDAAPILEDMEKASEKESGVSHLLERFKLKPKENSPGVISGMVESDDAGIRMKALVCIDRSDNDSSLNYISQLLRDQDYNVKVGAIFLCGKKKLIQYAPVLIDMLDSSRYYSFSYQALEKMVGDISDKLDHAFYLSSSGRKMKERILKLLCTIESPAVIPILVNKLDQPEIFLHKIVLKRLAEMNYSPAGNELQRITEYLQRMIGITGWNIAVKYSISQAGYSPSLLDAMEQEIRDMFQHVFDILSVMYDAQTIGQIRANIETGSSETIGYSLELLDLFVDENIKQSLFALLEDSTEMSTITALQTEFPIEIMSGEKLLHSIINRDFNFINTYTRILAILELSNLENYTAGYDLVAHLFNPDTRVAEVSAAQLFEFDRVMFNEVIPRLDRERKSILEKYIEASASDRDSFLNFSRIGVLKSSGLFEELSVFDLFYLSEKFRILRLKKGVESELLNSTGPDIFIYYESGLLEISDRSGQKKISTGPGSFYNLQDIGDFAQGDDFVLKSEWDMDLLYLPGSELRELIFESEDTWLPVLNILFNSSVKNKTY